jgi:glycosyltransferase involved in cell wall biosynthesis
MISVVILTFNEEYNIRECIESLNWCDDIHVVDSFSTDKTLNFAESMGVSVHQRKFISYADQHNWTHDGAGLKYDWVLHLDADERCTSEFHKEIQKSVSEATDEVLGFYCCWKLILFNTWLKHSDCYPRWQLRLVRKEHPPYIDFGHAQKEKPFEDHQLGYIHEPYEHFAFSRGWYNWFDRHNKYSTNEAKERFVKKLVYQDLFNSHKSKRAQALKLLVHKLPFWPLWRFCYSYFLRFGFLEGSAGFIYCFEIAHYEMMIRIKIKEFKHSKNPELEKEYGSYAK